MRILAAILLATFMLSALSCDPFTANADKRYNQDDDKSATAGSNRNQSNTSSCGPSG